jgi:uncharacterized membrane protein
MNNSTVPYKNNKKDPTRTDYTATASYYRSGILPEPAELERYEKLLPGTTDRLLQSYEKQAAHRMQLENKVIDGDSIRSTRGQIYSFIITMVVLIGGFLLIFLGKDTTGIVAILGALATLLGVFIGGSVSRSRERKDKAIQQKE